MNKPLPYHYKVWLQKEDLTVRELVAIIKYNPGIPIREILKHVRNGDLVVHLNLSE